MARVSRAIDSDVFIFAVLLAGYSLFTLAVGGVVMGYDSYAYERWADTLLGVRFNYASFFQSPAIRPLHAFRIGFITLIALTKMLCGDRWQIALIATNHLASAFAGVLLVRITRLVTGLRIAAWLSLGFYGMSFDVAHWNRFVLSDSTFLLLSFAVFFFAVRAIVTEDRPTARWISAAVLSLLAIFYRPTGCVVIVPLIYSFFSRSRRARGHAVSFVQTMIVFVLVAVMAFAAAALIVKEPARWPFRLGSKQIRMLSLRAGSGEVVEVHVYRPPPQRFGDFLVLYMDKFVRFFQITASDFSPRHNAYLLLFFVPLYGCALAAITWMAIQRRIGGREIAILVALVEILSFALFHALTIVDSIWRYRVPILPHLILLAAFGLAKTYSPRAINN